MARPDKIQIQRQFSRDELWLLSESYIEQPWLVFVFVYLYLCICICICVVVFVYLYLCICICVYVFAYLFLCICICVFVFVYLLWGLSGSYIEKPWLVCSALTSCTPPSTIRASLASSSTEGSIIEINVKRPKKTFWNNYHRFSHLPLKEKCFGNPRRGIQQRAQRSAYVLYSQECFQGLVWIPV